MTGSRLPKQRRREPRRRAAGRQLTRNWWIVGLVVVVAIGAAGVIIALTQATKGSEEETSTVPTVAPSERVCASGAVPVDGRVCGQEDAPVKMVEYSDYRCSWCGRFARETEPEIQREYVATGKVQMEFRNMAIEGEASELAAEAAECAAEQGKFWAYHDVLYENQQSFNAKVLKGFAEVLGLDLEAFDECLDSDRYADLIVEQRNQGVEEGVTGTPNFLINGELVRGALPFEEFRPIIENALREAGVEVTPEASEPTPSGQEEGP